MAGGILARSSIERGRPPQLLPVPLRALLVRFCSVSGTPLLAPAHGIAKILRARRSLARIALARPALAVEMYVLAQHSR
jgi:hypothetical protein